MKLFILGILIALSISIQLKDNTNVVLNNELTLINNTWSINSDKSENSDYKDDKETIEKEIEEAEKDAKNNMYCIYTIIENSIKILVDSIGYLIYKFSKDINGEATCLNKCGKKLSPMLIMNKDCLKQLPPELNYINFSTYKRSDGFYHIKYKNKPLYYYEGDIRPKDEPKGMNVTELDGEFTTVSL